MADKPLPQEIIECVDSCACEACSFLRDHKDLSALVKIIAALKPYSKAYRREVLRHVETILELQNRGAIYAEDDQDDKT